MRQELIVEALNQFWQERVPVERFDLRMKFGMQINPGLAKRMLADHESSKEFGRVGYVHLRTATLLKYADDMREGRWEYKLGDPAIKIATCGYVVNGQNRLTACVEAGVPFSSDVIFNARIDDRNTTDIGIVRTGADLGGFSGIERPNRVMAVAKLLIEYESGTPGQFSGKSPSKTEVHKRGTEDCREITQAFCDGTKGLCRQSVADFCNYLFRKADPRAAEEFMRKLTTGADMKNGHPVLTLRNRLAQSEKRSVPYVVAMFFKAWTSMLAGGTIYVIKWAEKERFPRI